MKPVTIRPERAPVKRKKQRRQYKGAIRAGVLTVGRGAFVTTIDRDGSPISEHVWDATRRLFANVGDTLIVSRTVADTFAVTIAAIYQRGRVEDWKLSQVLPDGDYRVMKGPKA